MDETPTLKKEKELENGDEVNQDSRKKRKARRDRGKKDNESGQKRNAHLGGGQQGQSARTATPSARNLFLASPRVRAC